MITDTLYQTSDLQKAAYLISAGHRLINVFRNDNRVLFCFDECQGLHDDLKELTFGNVEVVLKEFLQAQRDLKMIIFNN